MSRPKIAPRNITPHLAQMVVDLYINGDAPAWDVARAMGPEFGQNDIYDLARKLRAKLGIPYRPRKRAYERVDWWTAQALKDEGMTTEEIRDFFEVSHNTIEYSRINAKKPRRRYR